MLRRLVPHVSTAADWGTIIREAVIALAFSYQGLKAPGVPQASLDSFPIEFQQGMAGRLEEVLGDMGESSPANWEKPFATPNVHVAVSLTATDSNELESAVATAQKVHQDLPGVSLI